MIDDLRLRALLEESGIRLEDGESFDARRTLRGSTGGARSVSFVPGREPTSGRDDVSLDLRQTLGADGFHRLQRAWQLSLDREVMVRASAVSDAPAEQAILAESRVLALLDHPAVPTVHALVDDGEGRPAGIFEPVRGRPWSVMPGETPPAEGVRDDDAIAIAIDILREALPPLRRAHSLDILHLDLKPDHVLIGTRGEVVLDGWSIALDMSKSDSDRGLPRHATASGLLGTPAYMSPEQAEARFEDFGPWTDVYLLGAILCEILTGAPPHGAGDALEALRSAAEGRVPDLQETLPRDLVRLCRSALSADPALRPRSVDAFARELELYREHRAGIRMARRAAEVLEEAGRIESDEAYARFDRAIAGFEQAAELWKENPLAATGALRAREALARRARAAGDLALAEATLSRVEDPAARSLLEEIRGERRAHRASRRRAGRLKVTLLALLAVSLIGLAGGIASLNDRRRRADAAAEQADVATRAAVAAEGRAQEEERRSATSAEQARRRGAASKKAATDLLRLADLERVDRIAADLERLHPTRPERIAELEDLHRRVDSVLANLPAHELAHAELLAGTPADADADLHAWKTALSTRLIGALRELRRDALDTIEERIDLVDETRERTLVEEAEAWKRAASEVAADPRYAGLELAPQFGLIPLGRDPDSGLQEFVHWPSHDVDVSRRDESGRVPFDEGWGIVLILVPGGTFRMGAEAQPDDDLERVVAADETPPRDVRLDPFFISKYEMTQDQWVRMTGEKTPAQFPIGREIDGYESVGPLHPVESVSWNDCDALLFRLGLQIPTEGQWEYAARAGTTTMFWSGDDRETLRGNANISDASLARVASDATGVWPEYDDGYPVHAPVDTFAPNPFGLHHVTGNVGEWCRDWHADYDRPLLQGTGEQLLHESERSLRVFRPGNFGDAWKYSRSSARECGNPSGRGQNVGIRPGRSLETN